MVAALAADERDGELEAFNDEVARLVKERAPGHPLRQIFGFRFYQRTVLTLPA
jgi:hypothetical protein